MSEDLVIILEPAPMQITVEVAAEQPINVVLEQTAVPIAMSMSTPGPTGPAGPAGSSSVAKTAAQALSGHRLVSITAADEVDYADSSDGSALRVLGMTTGSAEAGAQVGVLLSGEISEPSWDWSLDVPIYLGAEGRLTQVQPTTGYLLQVGLPLSATNVLLDVRMPIALG